MAAHAKVTILTFAGLVLHQGPTGGPAQWRSTRPNQKPAGQYHLQPHRQDIFSVTVPVNQAEDAGRRACLPAIGNPRKRPFPRCTSFAMAVSLNRGV